VRRRHLALAAVPLLLGPCGPPTCTPPPAYSFLDREGDLYSRWDPCGDPITYQIDTSVGTQAERDAIPVALDVASEATGYTFEYRGESPDGQLAPGVEAMLGYADFPGDQLGEGGGYLTNDLEILEGFAYVETGLTAAENRHVLLHEIGHLLGLDHVDDDTQVMFTFVDRLFDQYQAGDLEGLRLVGSTMECFPATAALERAPRLVTWTDGRRAASPPPPGGAGPPPPPITSGDHAGNAAVTSPTSGRAYDHTR
jgi:hypothetical protein